MSPEELRKEFIRVYGEGDKKINMYFSPGRVNLIGEHTDYNGGFVFPCALTFGTYLLARYTTKNEINLVSLNQKYSANVPFEKLSKKQGNEWVNYPLGVFDQFIKKGISINKGIDILFWGNIPNGAGLSSSASLEVVTAFAINNMLNLGLNIIELVQMSQKAENEFVGVNCGIMDQFASGLGKKDHAIFLNCDTLEYKLVPISLKGIKVVISNTNSPHKLDASQYNQRVSECKKAVEDIKKVKNIALLGDLSEKEFDDVKDNISDSVVKKRAKHVVSEIQRTVDAVEALQSGNIEKFGNMMNASHVSLRDDYEVTGLELDTMVEAAWKVEGVIGSRMTGAGFGGCTVSLVKEESVDDFCKNVEKVYRSKTGLKADFYIADIGDGCMKIGEY